jgi:hypothetical protein
MTLGYTGADSWSTRLLRLVDDNSVVRSLGQAYLSLHAHERGAAALSKLLGSALMFPTAREHTADQGLDTLLSAKLRRDFEQRDTVILNGWILSRTEARLCALRAS